MIVTYLRSSSVGQFRMCGLSYYLQYTLGMRTPSNKAAAKGTITHKALEVLAWKAYHESRGNETFEDETFGVLRCADLTPDWLTEKAYYYYKGIETHLKWYDHPSPRGKFQGDLAECKEWTRKCLTSWKGLYNPANQVIVEPEKKFDFVIEEPWAKFDYDTPWGRESGQLGLKGTMDLVTRDKHDPEVLHVIDYKTGRRVDWATGEEKTYKKLLIDPQLLLYYYACKRLYPEAKAIQMSIVFINTGGPFFLAYGQKDLEDAEAMLRDYFERIRDTRLPQPRYGDHCNFCWFRKNEHPDSLTGESYCRFFTDRLRRDGADAVMREFGKPRAWAAYGDGGGRKASDSEDLCHSSVPQIATDSTPSTTPWSTPSTT